LVPTGSFSILATAARPPHVHVEHDRNVAKFRLDPVRLARSGGYRAPELREVAEFVRQHQGPLLEAWNDYFGR
jgi:hypothetical protein